MKNKETWEKWSFGAVIVIIIILGVSLMAWAIMKDNAHQKEYPFLYCSTGWQATCLDSKTKLEEVGGCIRTDKGQICGNYSVN